jgi:hypothetical protein
VTSAAVTKAIKAGRLVDSVVTDDHGFRWIKPDLADREWQANTEQKEGFAKRTYRKPEALKVAAREPVPIETPERDQPHDGPDDQSLPGEVTLIEAKRRLEAHKAELKRLELEERRGELVKITDVADTVAAEYARLRQRLLAIPGKAGQEVIAAEDTADAARIIEAYIAEALTELSEGGTYGDR